MELAEFKSLLDRQGEAFDAFKKSHEEQIAELKRGVSDPVLLERLGKVEKSLDAAVEAKAAFDRAIEAERKEREALEARINRTGLQASNTDEAKRLLDLRDFNIAMKSVASEKGQSFAPVDQGGYDAYKAAFAQFLRKNDRLLTSEEMKALSVGSDPDGGYFVTPDITGRIATRVFETSPVRQYASVQTITTDALEGTEDINEAGAGYADEFSSGTDSTTPQLGKWRIPVFWLATEPQASQQVLDDAAVDLEAWLAAKVGDKLGRLENNQFVAGAANRIRGFVSGYPVLADSGSGVTWGNVGYLATGVSGDWVASAKGDNLIDLMGLLKNQYLTNAAWFTRRSIITDIRKFKDGQNNYYWQPSFVAGQPETILGYPVARMEDFPAKAANSFSLAFGDLRAAYQIVDRQGVRVLRDPYTAKPMVKFWTAKRTGGGLVNFEAIKLLKFGTS